MLFSAALEEYEQGAIRFGIACEWFSKKLVPLAKNANLLTIFGIPRKIQKEEEDCTDNTEAKHLPVNMIKF